MTLVTTGYERGVTLTKAAMAVVEARLTRHPTLGKWFVDIHPPPDAGELIPRKALSSGDSVVNITAHPAVIISFVSVRYQISCINLLHATARRTKNRCGGLFSGLVEVRRIRR